MTIIVPGSAAVQAAPPPPLFPSTRGEYVTVLAHYHRAEIARMAGWRDRIDRTTNWALTVAAALLSVSLSTPTAHHGVVLFGMLIVLLLLYIEARRYRFFDVYRARVRRMERNYYAQIFAPSADAPPNWSLALGEDLRRPIFLISLGDAMSRRLRRNYIWIFLILLLAWALKITSGKLQPETATEAVVLSFAETVRNANVGPLPGWLLLLGVAAFYAWLLYATLRPLKRTGELDYGNVHV